MKLDVRPGDLVDLANPDAPEPWLALILQLDYPTILGETGSELRYMFTRTQVLMFERPSYRRTFGSDAGHPNTPLALRVVWLNLALDDCTVVARMQDRRIDRGPT